MNLFEILVAIFVGVVALNLFSMIIAMKNAQVSDPININSEQPTEEINSLLRDY